MVELFQFRFAGSQNRSCKDSQKKSPEHQVQGETTARKNTCAAKNSGTNIHSRAVIHTQEDTLLPAHFVFFHPDYTVGFGIAPNHALRLVGYTTGRESHPALKTVSTCLRCDDSTSRRQMQYPSAKKDKTGTLRERESRYGKDHRNLRRSLQLIALNLRTSVLPHPPLRREPQVLPLQGRERVLRR